MVVLGGEGKDKPERNGALDAQPDTGPSSSRLLVIASGDGSGRMP